MKIITATIVTIVTLQWCSSSVSAARILAVLPIFARSHHKFFQPLLKALARVGHEVVVYSPVPLATPMANYTDIVMDNTPTESDKITEGIIKFIEYPHSKCLDAHYEFLDVFFDPFVRSERIKTLLKSGQNFDLVFTEAYNTGHEYITILGHIFNAQVIVLQAYPTDIIANWYSGNPLSVAFKPLTCSPFSDKMTFYERFLNSFYVLRNMYYVYYKNILPGIEAKVRKHFPDTPPIRDLIQSVALSFVNDHLTEEYPQPRTPNIIPVAGIHIEDQQPLPRHIQIFMDEAENGVIYFSLGTYIPDDLKEKEYFEMYKRVFTQLKQRVLWKTRKENIQGLPANVKILEWAPQRDILAHPKSVLFITHGGLLSQHETVHCGVPVVVIPQFYDQHRNAMFYQDRGVGVRLTIPELSEASILAAIRTVLDNPRYLENMRKLSRVFRDRPMTPAETVVYWTEHVLRHGGSHLRPASTQLAWYQVALLDVLAVVISLTVSVSLVIYLCFRTTWRIFCSLRTNDSKQEKLS